MPDQGPCRFVRLEYVARPLRRSVLGRRWVRVLTGLAGVTVPLAASGVASAAGQSNLSETTPLVDAMFILSMAGAIVTFAILVWALIRFRDPATKGRRYG